MRLIFLLLLLASLTVQAQVDTGPSNLRTYNNIADMQLNASPFSGRAVQVLGYYQRDDGGGGIFSPTNSTTGVDGGLRVSSALSPDASWQRVYSGPVDVRWFGAKGDDSFNNAPAFQTAFTSVPPNSELTFPEGIYRVTANTTISKPLRITGKGTIKAMAGDFPLVVLLAGSSGTEISGVRYDSVSTLGNVQAGISCDVSGLSNIVVRGVKFGRVSLNLCDRDTLDTNAENRNVVIEGCFFNGNYTGAVYGNSTANICIVGGWVGFRVQNNTFDTIEGERCIKITGFSRDGLVDGNVIKAKSGSNAQIVDGQSARNWTLSNNKITGSGNWGSVLECKPGGMEPPNDTMSETLEISVVNNNVDFSSTNVAAAGLTIFGSWGLPKQTQEYSSAIMSKNKIFLETPNSRGACIVVRGFTDASVVGNTCVHSNYITFSTGLDVSNNRSASISGNVVERGMLGIGGRTSNAPGWIYTNSPQAVTITGNTIRDFYHVGAIYFLNDDGLTNAVITGNTIVANVDSGGGALIYVGAPSSLGFDRVDTHTPGVVTKIDHLAISGNSGTSEIGLYYFADPSAIIGRKVETGNSWQTDSQPLDSDLTELAKLTGIGFIVRSNTAGAVVTRTLVAGPGISIGNVNGVGGDITISSLVTSGEINTASNLGTGLGLFNSKNQFDLQFNSIAAGTGITVSSNANTLTIGGISTLRVQDEGDTPLLARGTLNFQGGGVSAVDDPGNNRVKVTIPGNAILNQTTFPTLPSHVILNFTGAGVTAYDDGSITSIGIPGTTVQDEGNYPAFPGHAMMNFTGAGVTATENVPSNRIDVNVPGTQVQDKGVNVVPIRQTLNFTGAGVTATDDLANNRTRIDIPGGGAGSGIVGPLSQDVSTIGPSGNVVTINNGVVTYAKMQNVSAASKLLGKGASGAGPVEEIILGTGLAMTGSTLSVSGGATGEVNTMSNLGGQVGVYAQKVASDLQLKSFVAGGGITLTPTATTITIGATTVGEANTGSNLGLGLAVYDSKSGATLRFNSFAAGAGLTAVLANNIITFSANPVTYNTFIALDNPTVVATAGTAKNFWRVPTNSVLTGVLGILYAPGGGSATFNVKKNGTAVITSTILVTTTTAVNGTLAAPAILNMAAGDVITADLTIAGSPKGPAVQLYYTLQ